MANTPSATKRILITERNRLQNRFYKSSVRTLVKLFGQHLDAYQNSQNTEDKVKAQKILNSAYSMIDKGCKRNVFHRNTAARKKSKLAAQLKAI
jgi:small subunit ribosomal protein S20